ncbi:hypothetical protein BJX64DRAFT_84750 [Aspergillus heterothallicus]
MALFLLLQALNGLCGYLVACPAPFRSPASSMSAHGDGCVYASTFLLRLRLALILTNLLSFVDSISFLLQLASFRRPRGFSECLRLLPLTVPLFDLTIRSIYLSVQFEKSCNPSFE